MLKEDVLEIVQDTKDQFIGQIFSRPKKGESRIRPILNLKPLNRHVQYMHFKMESIKEVKALLQKDSWMVKIDLKSAYWHLPIWEEHRKLLRFRWKGTLFQMKTLPFGLAPGPRIFTKVMKIPVALLRRQGVMLVIYLDDMLLVGRSLEEIKRAKDSTIFLLNQLGLTINYKKSILVPSKEMEFLGFVFNTTKMQKARH